MASILDWIAQYRYANYTVNPDLEDLFTAYHRFIGLLSISVNALHVYLLIKASHMYSMRYRLSLLLLQVWFIVLSIHLSFLFILFPVYPIFGGFSGGFIGTDLHISFHYQLVALIFIIDECIASILMVALFRNQSLVLSGRFKLSDPQLILVVIVLHVSLAANAFIFAFIDLDLEKQLVILATRFPGLAWVSTHGFVWAAYSWNKGAFLFFLCIVLQLCSFASITLVGTIRIVRAQRRTIRKRNDKRLKQRVRRVDTLVIAQILVAVFIMIIPLIIIGIGLSGCFPYYVPWTAVAFMAIYSLLNSCAVVSLNPKYMEHLKRRAQSKRTLTSVIPILVLTPVE